MESQEGEGDGEDVLQAGPGHGSGGNDQGAGLERVLVVVD